MKAWNQGLREKQILRGEAGLGGTLCGCYQAPAAATRLSRQLRAGERQESDRTHQSSVDLRIRLFGRGPRVLGIPKALAGRPAATTGSHDNTVERDAPSLGAAYGTAAGTN